MASRRQRIWDRARGRSEYCQLAQADTTLPHEIDHIRAKKHRGPTTLKNTCLACAQCNAAKCPNAAGYDPDTDELVPLFNPRGDSWTDHFAWDGPILVGKTRSAALRLKSSGSIAQSGSSTAACCRRQVEEGLPERRSPTATLLTPPP